MAHAYHLKLHLGGGGALSSIGLPIERAPLYNLSPSYVLYIVLIFHINVFIFCNIFHCSLVIY